MTATCHPRRARSAPIEAVVVGDYQASGQLGGFFVQEEKGDTDNDTATSEGLFVFDDDFDVVRW